MGETQKPFAVAPMLRPDGKMIDGTPLASAIQRLDDDTTARPWHYMLGCLYPTNAESALEALFRAAPSKAHRVVGLKANASPLSPEELDRSERLERKPPEEFAQAMWECANRFGLNVLGGCCGTDAAYIAAIAEDARARA
jgi:homocysteine S-methyltransferase